MTIRLITPLLIVIGIFQLQAQKTTLLKADGPGDTYVLINKAFTPIKGSAIEAPGVIKNNCDNHSSYQNSEGNNNHITEVIDKKQGPVFQFTVHAKEDIDRDKCQKKDRQRNEIKTYKSSPDYLKATKGEKVEYKWTMKLPKDFQPCNKFTHLHQIKSVGGIKAEEKIPLITFTAYRKESGDVLNIRYAPKDKQETIAKIKLNKLYGNWLEFTETIDYSKRKGNYSLTVKNLDNHNKIIFELDKKIDTYKKNAEFMRPKWGIYRSLKEPTKIKDESILFGYFKITEF